MSRVRSRLKQQQSSSPDDEIYASHFGDFGGDGGLAQSFPGNRGRSSYGRNRGRATTMLSFVTDGAQRFEAALDCEVLKAIETVSSALPSYKPGVRFKGNSALDAYLAVDGQIGAIARSILGSRAKPVRAIVFNKMPLVNWKLGWHQDRTIAVRGRADVAGYGPWSTKAGLQHVEPPFDLLAAMVTLRIHLDNVGPDNAPLLIAPGSHRFGRVRGAEIGDAVKACGVSICLAGLGDVWLYATPILHASDAAVVPTRRRVLQVDYSGSNLPAGLDWLGV